MSRHTLSLLLLVAIVVLAVLAAATLIPSSSLMVSDLGYRTFCPFAPYSTITLLFLAALGWAVRRHINAQEQ
jgi:hypothetical protein